MNGYTGSYGLNPGTCVKIDGLARDHGVLSTTPFFNLELSTITQIPFKGVAVDYGLFR